jgi:hypothetical protein
MRGYIEVKEDQYEDLIEHLYRMKTIACKLIDKLSERSEVYEETPYTRKTTSRYEY